MGVSSSSTERRIAVVQHGDYRSALSILDDDRPEPYFGMRESVQALERLFQHGRALVISLDAAESYRERHGQKTLIGLPMPSWCKRIPRLRSSVYARLILREVRRFAPTQVLLRTGGTPALTVANYCQQAGVPLLVVLANALWTEHRRSRRVNEELMRLLSQPFVDRVYNYKPTACMSMVDYGLSPEKATAYQFGGERKPEDYPVKRRPADADCHIVFAARMVKEKGPLDLVEAVLLLQEQGVPARATLFGDGPELSRVRARAQAARSGSIVTPGWVDNATLFQSFLKADLVCVPTRPEFVEGMPMSLTEALASRTPVIASDCPVFKRTFTDGQGVKFFKAGDPAELANVVNEVWTGGARYMELSEGTRRAFDTVSVSRTFSDVLLDWEHLD